MADPYTHDQAVAALKRVAKRWPRDLGLFSWNGSLAVMQLSESGEWPDDGFYNDAVIGYIDIPNDGGDPD